MKKRILSIILAFLMLAPFMTQLLAPAVSTADDGNGISACITGADTAITQFAAGEIGAALEKCGITVSEADAEWTICFLPVQEELGEQSYTIHVSDKTIEIAGGDENGLLYGGLEAAEQIALGGGPEAVKESEGSPTVLNRGIKFNIPLDMRTPSYTDAGDAAQLNMEDMWDIEFWHEELDELARNRYNVMSIWNLNPFPSMLKLEDYPDVALDDVWRMTLPLDGSYNGTATDMVRPEHWENYEVIKKMTIDEKIAFWQEVMAYAHDRGIQFYIFTWNIYTYGENGKYGITSDVENEVTRDYFRKSVQAMVETYPDLDGLGFSAGENMDWSFEQNSNELWLYDTYGRGINAALESQPEREFKLIHRRHLVYNFEELRETWAGFKGTLDFSDKYSYAHMHSSTTPHFADDTLSLLPADLRTWLELRCDDLYYARWGDADFIRDYVSGMPDASQLRGFFYGADGNILGRDYTSLDEEEYGQMHIEKHWYEYMLIGRLAYNPSLTNEDCKALFALHFDGAVDSSKTDLLFEAVQAAGKIIPQVTRFFWIDTDAYYPEMCLTHRTAFGFLSVKNYANFSNALDGAGVLAVPDYVDAVQAGQEDFDLQTPPEVAQALADYSAETMKYLETLLADEPETFSSFEEKEFYSMAKDQLMQALMGLYYSEKISAAVDLKLYNATSDTAYQNSSIEHLNKAVEYWKAYAAEFEARYRPLMMSRLQVAPDPMALIKDVEKDISIAQKWRIR